MEEILVYQNKGSYPSQMGDEIHRRHKNWLYMYYKYVLSLVVYCLYSTLEYINHSNVTIANEVFDWHVWLQRIEEKDHYCVLLAESNGF